MKNILAISGSLRIGSSNYTILNYLKLQAKQEINYTIYNLLESLPPFDPGKDADNAPVAVTETRKLITETDGIVICTPEYAFGVPGALKNMLDWLVSSGSMAGKPTMLITASLNGEYAHSSLILTLGALSANVVLDASFVISFIRSKINADGEIIDTDAKTKISEAFNIFLDEL